MPHYKDPGNRLHWLDSKEHENYLPVGCVEITDVEADAIRAEQAQAAEAALTYAQQRAAEYPSIPDQLDTLYHGGYDAWKATIQAVKDKYPKPAAQS